MLLDSSTIRQPANGGIACRVSHAFDPASCRGWRPVGDPGGLDAERRGLPLPRERRHAGPCVTVSLTGLVTHMGDHVDIGRL